MDIEKLRKRYQGPMMNQDIMDCIEEIERLNKFIAKASKWDKERAEEIERLRKAIEKIEIKSDFNKSSFNHLRKCRDSLLAIFEIIQALKEE